jgi:hypothetical protein
MAITLDGSANNIAIGANATGSSFLRLYEDTDNGSNYIDLIAPSAVGSNRVLTLPDSTTTIVGTDVAQTLTNKTLGSGLVMAVSALTSATAVVNPTSPASSSIDFTNIPSWVKRITVIFSGLSLTSTADILVQLGDAGGFETTGYISSGSATGTGAAISTSTTGMIIRSAAAASVTSGIMTIQNLTGNSWVASYSGKQSSTSSSYGGGDKTLSDTLTQVRITTTSTDTFDAGTINIMYE